MEDENKNPDAAVAKLAVILTNKKKGYLLPKIIKRARSLYLKRHGIKIFLAKDHPQDVVEKIKEKMLPQLKKRSEHIEVCVDKDLIGGFRMKGGNFLVRASIKDFLDELRARLMA